MLLALLVVGACGATQPPEATSTPAPLPDLGSTNDFQDPPTLLAVGNAQAVLLGNGTHQWLNRGMGSAADAPQLVTQPRPLPIPRGGRIEISGDLPWLALAEMRIEAGPATQNRFVGHAFPEWWDLPEGVPAGLGSALAASGVTLTLDFEPGLYVVHLWVHVNSWTRPSGWGDASYGLLVEVTP